MAVDWIEFTIFLLLSSTVFLLWYPYLLNQVLSNEQVVSKSLQGLSIESALDLQKVLRVETCTSQTNALQRLEANLPLFQSRMGALLFLISALLSRGLVCLPASSSVIYFSCILQSLNLLSFKARDIGLFLSLYFLLLKICLGIFPTKNELLNMQSLFVWIVEFHWMTWILYY